MCYVSLKADYRFNFHVSLYTYTILCNSLLYHDLPAYIHPHKNLKCNRLANTITLRRSGKPSRPYVSTGTEHSDPRVDFPHH